MRVDRRAVLDLLPRQADLQHFLALVKKAEGIRGEQHLSARQPRARIGHQVAERPCFVIEIEVLDLADVAIGRGKFVTDD